MHNLYADLNTIKSASYLGSGTTMTATTYDTQLLDLLEEGSRQFDNDTDRFFYIYEGDFYQDGGASRVILDWDVQSISSLIIDVDGQNLYPTTSAYTVDINSPTTPPDVYTYPANSYPKTVIEANPNGSYGHLGAGYRKAIKITGTFGYGNDWPGSNYINSGTVIAGDLTATTTALTASTGGFLSAGMTLRIDSEQAFVSETNSTGSTATIVRAGNGTTAATHSTGAAINIYQYPQAVSKAVLIYAMRGWKRRESAYQNVVMSPDMGSFSVWRGDDPDYKKTVLKYQKVRRMWSF